jgi:hypothetical protein
MANILVLHKATALPAWVRVAMPAKLCAQRNLKLYHPAGNLDLKELTCLQAGALSPRWYNESQKREHLQTAAPRCGVGPQSVPHLYPHLQILVISPTGGTISPMAIEVHRIRHIRVTNRIQPPDHPNLQTLGLKLKSPQIPFWLRHSELDRPSDLSRPWKTFLQSRTGAYPTSCGTANR